MSAPVRFFFGVILSLSLAVCGLALGTVLGGRFLVPGGQGLAGPAEALGYGALLAVAGLITGILLAYMIRGAMLRMLTLVAFLPAAAIAAYIFYAIRSTTAEMGNFLDEQIAGLQPFTLVVAHADPTAGWPFSRVEFDTAENAISATLPDGSMCTGVLPPTSRGKADLLAAIRNTEFVLSRQPNPCTDGGPVVHEVDFHVEEALPPNTTRSVAITDTCLGQHPDLRVLIERAGTAFASHICE